MRRPFYQGLKKAVKAQRWVADYLIHNEVLTVLWYTYSVAMPFGVIPRSEVVICHEYFRSSDHRATTRWCVFAIA